MLKIDRSFVTDIVAKDGIAAAIVNSIIMLAQALKLKVIAEGVETKAQSEYLREHGCTELQGYYFIRLLDADSFAALVRSGTLSVLFFANNARTLNFFQATGRRQEPVRNLTMATNRPSTVLAK